MTVGELTRLRTDLGLTQTGMARAMGLSMRAYQDIEALDDEADLRERHKLLAERCSLSVAVRRRDPMLAVASIRREAQDLMAMFRGERG